MILNFKFFILTAVTLFFSPNCYSGQIVINPAAFGTLKDCSSLLLDLNSRTISPKYTYMGKGAALWEQLMMNSDHVANEPEVLLLKKLIPTVLNESKFIAGVDLIDIGPGDGRKAAEIFKMMGKTQVSYLGVDVSPEMLELAKKNISSYPGINIKTEVGDFEDNTFRLNQLQTDRPSLYLLLGQTIGNLRDPVQALSNIRKNMIRDSELIVGMDMFAPERIPELVAEYRNPAYLDMDLWVLREFGLEPNKNGTIHIDFNHSKRDIEAVFILSDDHIVTQKESDGSTTSIRLRKGEKIQFFNSHRFDKTEAESIFAAAGYDVVGRETNQSSGYTLFRLKPSSFK